MFDTEKIELTAQSSGFMPGTVHYVWMYSKEKDGVYEELKAPQVRNFVPSRAGFYKVKATDRVYSCESEPVEAGLKTTDCQPVEIICTDRDYVCKDSKTILKSSLIGNEYKYKWYVGRLDATDVEDLREVPGETSSTLQASANAEDEGYFLQVEKDRRTILSYPFHVRKLATMNGNVSLDLQMFPATVCEGSIVNIKASVLTNVFDFALINGTYDYRFFKKGLYDYDYREVKYVKSARSTAILQEVASAPASYKVEVIGCNGKNRKDEPVDMVPRNDNSCNANEIYVKEDGNDDENDGRSWATAFQTRPRMTAMVPSLKSSPCLSSCTSYSFPRKVYLRPALRVEPYNTNSSIGNCLSSSTLRNSCPTAPLAPTIATFIFLLFSYLTLCGQRYEFIPNCLCFILIYLSIMYAFTCYLPWFNM